MSVADQLLQQGDHLRNKVADGLRDIFMCDLISHSTYFDPFVGIVNHPDFSAGFILSMNEINGSCRNIQQVRIIFRVNKSEVLLNF